MEQKYRKSKKYSFLSRLILMLFFINILLICALAVCIFKIHTLTANARQSDFLPSAAGSAATEENGTASLTEEEVAEECREIYEANKDLLILVNKENAIPDDYTVDLQLVNSGRFYVAALLYEDLKEMLSDAADNGYSYYLVSGYRDSEYQQQLIDRDVESYMSQYGMTEEEALQKTLEQVMPAGYSEHETGLALDITEADYVILDETQADCPSIIWLQENSWKYGFILRYPEDKEEITQISYEPWHFRYVGYEAAQFLYEHNLTLEEFYEYLE